MKSNSKLQGAALCISLIFALTACNKTASNADSGAMFTDSSGFLTVPAASPLRSHLEVQPVSAAGGTRLIELPAMVEADPGRVANIMAPLTGRVVALKVGLGDRVKQGQVLAVLASGDMAQAFADDDKARDAYNLAQKALDRARGVHEAGGGADKDLEAAESAYNQALAELNRAQTRLKALNGDTAGHAGQLLLKAPQNGVVTALSVASGAQVTDPTATLMTVTNLERVFVTVSVAENQIGIAGVGTPADITLTAYPNQTFHGAVTAANPMIEPDTRREKVRIALDNSDGRLMPNMYATVRLAAPAESGVLVPETALLLNNDSTIVFVEVQPWVFQRRAVQMGEETDTTARVLSGLAVGDRIVVKGGILLND